MDLQVGVKALLQNQAGQYLLVKRSDKKYQNIEGHWDIVGGRINPGTPLIENLKREIKEETDLELVDIPLLIAAQDIFSNTDRHVVRLTYLAKVTGILKLDKEENIEYKWLTLEQVKSHDDLDKYFKQIVNQIKD
jgi:ADP-ribose pyrophosphatase YjhB (NUDIX family)